MGALVFVVLHLVVLHTVDGYEVTIAPSHVTSLHAAKDGKPNELFTKPVRCVVSMADGKFVTVTEKCSVVRQLLENAK